MKAIRISVAVLAAATVGLVAGSASAAVLGHSPAASNTTHAGTHSQQIVQRSKVIAFTGTYAGTASLLINGNNIKIQSVKGTGTASAIGKGSVAATGNAVSDGSSACTPFKGTGSMTGKTGKITFSVSTSNSKGCSNGQSGPVTITVNGFAKVTGGTGNAKGAKGNLKFSGKLNLKDTSGSQSGKFSGKLTGKLTVS